MPYWKRAFDLAFSLCVLALSLPLFVLIGVAIKLTSPGPVFFVQWRTGFQGKPFKIYKFRTLMSDTDDSNEDLLQFNERDGPAFKISTDPRATPIGNFMRKAGLDELPQVWNILRGEMSWVGPRPLPCREAEACEAWQKLRCQAVPGITCLWQIERREVTFDEWMKMDLEYVERQSPWLDLKILLSTPGALLTRFVSSPRLSPNIHTVSTEGTSGGDA